MNYLKNIAIVSIACISFLHAQSNRDGIKPGSDRSEGKGPFKRMVIRGATLINGNGSPPIGPVDIVIENPKVTRNSFLRLHDMIMSMGKEKYIDYKNNF